MRSLTLLILLTASLTSLGQVTNLSPYSRFGIGDPDQGAHIPQFSMAGTGVAVLDGLHVNSLNPAGQSFLTSPVFELGISTERLEVSSSEESSTNSTSRINHFTLGFPMWGGKWGAAFGLKPYTSVGYDNSVTQYSSALDTSYTAEYIGDGGVNRIFLDLSRKITLQYDTSKYKQNNYVSLGAQGNYLFGSVSSERNTVFPSSSGFMSTRVEDATTITDLTWGAGVLFRYFLDRKTHEEDRFTSTINLGATISFAEELNRSRRSRDAYSFIENLSGIEFVRDSITQISGQRGTINLPSSIAVGLSYELYALNNNRNRQRRLIIALDHRQTDWTSLSEDFGTKTTYSELGEYSMSSLGLAYSPQIGVQKGTRGNIFRLSTYRLGYRLGTSHLALDGESIDESGISFGMSIPLLVKGKKETDTQFDFGLAYERRGTTENSLLEEQGLRVMFGFSFHPDYRFDRWFAKRKYD